MPTMIMIVALVVAFIFSVKRYVKKLQRSIREGSDSETVKNNMNENVFG